jgi:NifU-like protein involved in Fe-S cluster formation
MIYNELTRRRFDAPSFAGAASGADWSRGQAGSRQEGTWVQFDVQASGGVVRCARFLAFGCPHVIAAADWVAENAPGLALGDARLPEGVQALRARFEVPVEKMGRLLIVEDALLAALRRAAEGPPEPSGPGG